MEKFKSINPYTNEVIQEYATHNSQEIREAIDKAENTYQSWRKSTFSHRSELVQKVAIVLRANKDRYAKMMVAEMGKPILQAYAEVEKCAWVCEYYAANAASFLSEELVATDAKRSSVQYQPLGVILAIMPWNFPFWQVFRFAIPALMAGNVCLLKHAQNVIGSSLMIDEIFDQAGFPDGSFKSLIISAEQTAEVIEHTSIKAVTLTGSERAGKSVAATAGRNIKKTVLELGGSNAFVVLKDADLEKAAEMGCSARMKNNGQSCIAAKRFIIEKEVAEEFTTLLKQKIEALEVGNPTHEKTDIGPLARIDLAETLEMQVQKSIDNGAKLLIGHKREQALYHPTIITNVRPDMPAFNEELFGPVAPIIIAENAEEALMLSNRSNYGLGVTVCTNNKEHAQLFIDNAEDGAVFVNAIVQSDPRLPFGGTKLSGYGRELSSHGIKEFVNVKTVYINDL